MTETEITDLKRILRMFLPEVSSAVITKNLLSGIRAHRDQ